MSLDVYLEGDATNEPIRQAIFIRRDGQTREVSREEWDQLNPGREPAMLTVGGESVELYSSNVTHNLGKMAGAAGIYECLWRPDEHGFARASDLISPLSEGLMRLRAEPDKFKALNPENGWGSYDGFCNFVENYLSACKQFPDAKVRVSR